MNKVLLFVGVFLSEVQASRGPCEDLVERLDRRGVKSFAVSKYKNRYLRFLDIIFTIIRTKGSYERAHIDVYSGAAFCWAETAGCLFRLFRKPYYLTLHGGNLPEFSKKNEKRVKKLLRSAKAVITPSKYLLESMMGYASKIDLIPNPIDILKYNFILRKSPSPKVVWLRAFHTIYNPALAVSVLSLLKTSLLGAELTMIGPDKRDGSLRRVRKLVESLNVKENICFILGVSKAEVPKALEKGDVFINTTNIDNTPVSVIEAMACGLCIVSTNVGGIPYLLEHEKDALLVPPNDPEAMANAIKRLFNEPGLAETLSRNARAKAETFDWSHILPKWEALLKSIA